MTYMLLTSVTLKESKYIEVALASCGQLLAHQMSVLFFDIDQLPKYDLARVTGYCPCNFILIIGLCISDES